MSRRYARDAVWTAVSRRTTGCSRCASDAASSRPRSSIALALSLRCFAFLSSAR
eukprot:CAMPEP_0114161032 /NCGR_PEP_ID=MMETSP0043_2-20121206/28705_1 /TAXON_ID=464988 /ORGANISM="Hemiselmis andersenii, Strain CCMP644" /LENGTH=53 /DNA_ID=CAMNT_0001257173 /DNA_START=44 /DNA_END=201 /DNA_ORIENTATION=+